MSYVCPSCNQRTITAAMKRYAAQHAPAKCPSCGGLSAKPTWAEWIYGLVWGARIMAAPLAAIMTFSLWPIGAFILAAIAERWATRFYPLHRVTESEYEREYRVRMLLFFGVIAVAAISSLWK